MAGGELVRWEVRPLERSKRGPDEWIAIAAPWLTRRLTAFVLSRPAGSRVRRAALTQAVRRNTAANNRGDYRAMFATYHPDIEMTPPDRGRRGGFDAVYHGHDGVRDFIVEWKSGFGRHTYTPREIADPGGNRFALRFGLAGTIGDTDVEVPAELGVVNTFEGGLVVRQEYFPEWADAVAALDAGAAERREARSVAPQPSRSGN